MKDITNIKMNKIKVLSFAFVALTSVMKAQDLQEAKKSIDAEQLEKAKGILKSIVKNIIDNLNFISLT